MSSGCCWAMSSMFSAVLRMMNWSCSLVGASGDERSWKRVIERRLAGHRALPHDLLGMGGMVTDPILAFD